jgi:hypothetical protein
MWNTLSPIFLEKKLRTNKRAEAVGTSVNNSF